MDIGKFSTERVVGIFKSCEAASYSVFLKKIVILEGLLENKHLENEKRHQFQTQNIQRLTKNKQLMEHLYDFSNQHHSVFMIVAGCTELSDAQKEQVIEDWENQPHLVNFFKIIVTKIPIFTHYEFMFLSWMIWQNYKKIDYLQLNFTNDSTNLVEKLTASISGNILAALRNIIFLLGQQKFDQFLKSYSHTIYLIAQGYFDNPYYSECPNLVNPSHESIILDQRFSNNYFQLEEQGKIRIGLPIKMPRLQSNML